MSQEEVAEIRSKIANGESCKLGERVGMTVGSGTMVAVPGGVLVKAGKMLSKMNGKDGVGEIPADGGGATLR